MDSLVVGLVFAGGIGVMISLLLKSVKRMPRLPVWPIAGRLLLGGIALIAAS